jgi:hypothetical protein
MAGTTQGGKKAAVTTRKKLGTKRFNEIRVKGGKTRGRGYFGYLKEHNPAKLRQIIADREAKRKAKNARNY